MALVGWAYRLRLGKGRVRYGYRVELGQGLGGSRG